MNLGDQKTRPSRQGDRIGRRTSIIEERRDTRAPAYRGSASIRTARRGDVGGADALMKTLGMVKDAASEYADYAAREHATDERDNIARGYADEAAGTVDEELLAKSDGYRNAVTKGRTVTDFTTASREFNSELQTYIEGQTSPSLEVRQAEVSAMIEGFYRDFAQDPETGELRERLQSPGAARYLAEAIQQSRPDALSRAREAIEEKFNGEALEHYGKNIADQPVDNRRLDLTAARELLPDTVSEKQVSEMTLVALGNAIEELRDKDRFDDAADLAFALRGYADAPRPSTAPTVALTGSVPVTSGGDPDLLRMPVQGSVTSNIGDARDGGRKHNGMDIAVPVGTPVPAALGGEVVRVWTADAGGLSVKVKYDDGTVVGLAHLDSTDLEAGQRIAPGQTIAITGNSGKSTGPHLHYTVTQGGKKVDPSKAEFGEVASAAPAEPPQFRLRDPNASPFDASMREREPMEIIGLDAIEFSQEQRARIGEFVDAQQAEIRREWEQRRKEQQSSNATALSLGVLGIGGFTGTQDIIDAYEGDDISAEQAYSLVRLKEQRIEKAERDRERQETRRERAERERRQEYAQDLIDSHLGRFYRGAVSGPELLDTVIGQASAIGDPEIASALISAANTAVSGYENALSNSAPVRRTQRSFEEKAASAADHVEAMGIPRSRQGSAAKEWRNVIDRANAKYMELVMAGEDQEEAMRAAARLMVREENRIERTYSLGD